MHAHSCEQPEQGVPDAELAKQVTVSSRSVSQRVGVEKCMPGRATYVFAQQPAAYREAFRSLYDGNLPIIMSFLFVYHLLACALGCFGTAIFIFYFDARQISIFAKKPLVLTRTHRLFPVSSATTLQPNLSQAAYAWKHANE